MFLRQIITAVTPGAVIMANQMEAENNARRQQQLHEAEQQRQRQQQPLRITTGWVHVPVEKIEEAMSIYQQNEAWACGPHSAARARIMCSKMSVQEFPAFIANCPRTSYQFRLFGMIDVGNTSIGPPPGDLARYSHGTHISSRGTSLREHLVTHLNQGKPAVVLITAKPGTIFLHYIVLVGYNAALQSFFCLDGNNPYNLSASDLDSRMDIPVVGKHAILYE